MYWTSPFVILEMLDLFCCFNSIFDLERHDGQVVRAVGYGAESHCKVSLRLGFAMQQRENSLCQPSSKWVPFSN